MALFKCKSCGGDLIIEDNSTVCECEYCGTKQPIPSIRDENLQNLFNRANVLRMKSEFDKAADIYEKIIQKEEGEAEAYWGLILCRYGIEYVEDPETFKRIPTCHRASFESITADDDYKSALQYADLLQKRLYEEEAKKIDEIQKGILALAQKDDPFDVFICYKETDESGKRTQDSAIANDIYYQLTQEGFKVFYAAITLEDKLGSEYEPHIFAALNTAKVMLVLGTKPEYFNAVWVKNEWSRFLAMMKKDRSKMLIPCYRDMDPYELPEEFSHLQAQDMSKIGFINDITRGIKKVLHKDELKPTQQTTPVQQAAAAGANVAPLLERAFMFLEDGNWQEADQYCEKVLDQDPKNAQAYLGKLMAELKVRKQGDLKNCAQPFDGSNNYQKALRFADPTLAEMLKGYITSINERNKENAYQSAVSKMQAANNEDAYKAAAEALRRVQNYKDSKTLAQQCLDKAEICRKDAIYNKGTSSMNAANTESAFKTAADTFATISGFKDADALAEQCLEKAEICRKDAVYASAKSKMAGEKAASYEEAIGIFKTISGWKDVDEQICACQKKIEEIKAKEEADRLEAERKAEERRIAAEKAAKKRKKAFAIGTPIVAVCIAFVIVLTTVIIPTAKKNAFIEKYGQEVYNMFGLVEKGKTIKFGSYEQDNYTSNGKEKIEWLVLKVEGDKALVISKYALECQPYNTSNTDVTWESCSLRKWLNDDFLNEAFSKKEQSIIAKTDISADKNPEYSTNPGNATTDKIFLLSITEAEKYFTTDESRKCAPTAYAESQGAWTLNHCKTASGEVTCRWWLRSPGETHGDAADVDNGGSVYCRGWSVDSGYACVRPALWINLDS